MPLESKIPMVPGPEGAYNFTRRKIGQGLWIPTTDAEFNLSDPYCYEMKLGYDSLHDKHLVPFFSRPNNLQHLIKAGLITKDLDAKCSLRDYNMYRKYLRRIHCDSIKKELAKRTKLSIEDSAIQYAQDQAKKEERKLKERENLMALRRAIIRSRKRAERLKLQKQKEKQQKAEEKVRALIQKHKEDQRLRQIKSAARTEFIKQKQLAAADIRRRRIIQTFLEWNRKERRRRKTRQMRLAQEKEDKRKILEQKWVEKQQFQQQQIEKEQMLLKCVEDQRKHFIKAYNEKVKKEEERMKRLLKDVKMYIRCYLARRRPENKERICCPKSIADDDMLSKSFKKTSPKMQDTKKGRMKTIEDSSPQVRTLMLRKSSPQTESKKQEKRSKMSKARKGSKKRKAKRRKKREKVEEVEEEEEKPDIETIRSESTLRTEVTDAHLTPELDERCRCQIIKDIMKTI
nr:PREDICTED: calponin homology domain-containing protein DDB_G0272472-like [Megachile rotundata]